MFSQTFSWTFSWNILDIVMIIAKDLVKVFGMNSLVRARRKIFDQTTFYPTFNRGNFISFTLLHSNFRFQPTTVRVSNRFFTFNIEFRFCTLDGNYFFY